MKRILRYLVDTHDAGQVMKPNPGKCMAREGVGNADCASDPNDRCSIGFSIFSSPNLISWQSKNNTLFPIQALKRNIEVQLI